MSLGLLLIVLGLAVAVLAHGPLGVVMIAIGLILLVAGDRIG